MLSLKIFFTILFVLIAFSILGWTLYNGIGPMPTSPKVKRLLLAVLPDPVFSGVVYELGSGWGTLIFALAKRYPHLLIVGLENSPFPFGVSVLIKWLIGYSNVRLYRKDFFDEDLGQAAMVVCYLYPQGMVRLKKKLEDTLRPGVWVISHTFAIPGWPIYAVYEATDIYRTKIYVYRK